jgi:hypothetical protein
VFSSFIFPPSSFLAAGIVLLVACGLPHVASEYPFSSSRAGAGLRYRALGLNMLTGYNGQISPATAQLPSAPMSRPS